MAKTIRVDDATYEVLRSYKIGEMTLADVIRSLMEHEDPERYHAHYQAWQNRVLQDMRRSDEYENL